MKVIIESPETQTRSGKSANGRDWSMITQSARLVGEYIAGPLELTLGNNQPPYPAGEYDLNLEKSIALTQYGQIQISRNLNLKLVKANPVNFAKQA